MDRNEEDPIAEVDEEDAVVEVDVPSQSDRLPGLAYCLNANPPMWQAVLFGFYHYVLKLGVSCIIIDRLVKVMGGTETEVAKVLQATMFVTGWSTIFQTLFGTRLPAIVGATTQCSRLTSFVIALKIFSEVEDPHQRFLITMRAIQGAQIVSSIFQLLIGFAGFWRAILWLLSPLSAVPLLTGLGLGFYKLTLSELGKCLEVGIPMLVLTLTISVYMPRLHARRRAIYEHFGPVFSVGIIWVYVVILNYSGAYCKSQTGRSDLIKAAPWVRIPYAFQWGKPTFDIGVISIMLAGSIVSVIESTGAMITIARHAGATHLPPSIISRGIGWQGVDLFLNGIFGTLTGSAASNENAGFLGWTQIGSRRVIQITSVFMIVFSVFGKFQAIFASVPSSMIFAMCCICYGCGASGGFSLLQYCNLNCFRTRFILGFSLFFAFSVPYFVKEHNTSPYHDNYSVVNSFFKTIFLSEATVGLIVALFVDHTIEFSNRRVRRESGFHWWRKFMYYSRNQESQEDYALPFGLDEWFPPL